MRGSCLSSLLSLSLSLSLSHTHTHTHILCMYTVKYKYGEIYLHSLRLLNLSVKVIKVNNIGLELCLFISNNSILHTWWRQCINPTCIYLPVIIKQTFQITRPLQELLSPQHFHLLTHPHLSISFSQTPAIPILHNCEFIFFWQLGVWKWNWQNSKHTSLFVRIAIYCCIEGVKCVCVCVCVRGLVDVMGTKCSHTIISK